MFISERRRRRPVRPAALIALLLAAVTVLTLLVVGRRTSDVERGEKVEFRASKPRKPARQPSANWAFYHLDAAHRGYLRARLRPPFRRAWRFTGRVLMEFPVIVVRGTVYFIRNNGGTYALDARTGRVKWKRRIGLEAASSPAYWKGRLFVTSLSNKVAALRARDGRVLWEKSLPSRTESSPVVRAGVVYFGSENGTLYALWARTGNVRWTFNAAGALKASPALAGSTLYIGDYSGRMYAIWARTGRQRWATGTSGRTFGLASGNFYSTPAVDFGRVYAGNTDGKVYSFSARTGTLAWSRSTGGYVYSSPALANVPGTRPSVYVGSYDGNLYALDARTGGIRWTHAGGGRVSGGPTVIGRIVYFADLDSNSTYGVDARNGRRLFRFPRGKYNPVVSDGRRLYLTGYSSITALEPKGRRARRRAGPDRRHPTAAGRT